MHEVLQTYLTTMYTETVKKADLLNLDVMLADRMKFNFIKIKSAILEKKGNIEFCTKEEMNEFYNHGLDILNWFKKKRGSYFSKKGYELVGIEIPIEYKLPNDIVFIGYVDVIIKDLVTNKYKIIDIKTSTMGWNKYMKADKKKADQLLLYKQFYSKQNNIPLNKIDVEYFIVKRKLYEKVDFPQRRVQIFVPANGTPSINRVVIDFKNFIDECFIDGKHNVNHNYKKVVTNKNCKWCEFKDRPDLCDRVQK
jgi:hypothetical protein